MIKEITPFPEAPRLAQEIKDYAKKVLNFVEHHIQRERLLMEALDSTKVASEHGLRRLEALENLAEGCSDLKDMADELISNPKNDIRAREIRAHYQGYKSAMDMMVQIVSSLSENQ